MRLFLFPFLFIIFSFFPSSSSTTFVLSIYYTMLASKPALSRRPEFCNLLQYPVSPYVLKYASYLDQGHGCKQLCLERSWSSHRAARYRRWVWVKRWWHCGTRSISARLRWLGYWFFFLSLLRRGRILGGFVNACAAFRWAAATRNWSIFCRLTSSI